MAYQVLGLDGSHMMPFRIKIQLVKCLLHVSLPPLDIATEFVVVNLQLHSAEGELVSKLTIETPYSSCQLS